MVLLSVEPSPLDKAQRKSEAAKKRARYYKWLVFNHYSRGDIKCSCCGTRYLEFLTIDHDDENGAEHRRRLGSKGGGMNVYRDLVKNNFPVGFSVKCWSCNLAKHIYGKCPHQAEREDDLSAIRPN